MNHKDTHVDFVHLFTGLLETTKELTTNRDTDDVDSSSRVCSNPGFFKKAHWVGFYWVFLGFIGYPGFIGFFLGFIEIISFSNFFHKSNNIPYRKFCHAIACPLLQMDVGHNQGRQSAKYRLHTVND